MTLDLQPIKDRLAKATHGLYLTNPEREILPLIAEVEKLREVLGMAKSALGKASCTNLANFCVHDVEEAISKINEVLK